MLSIILQELSDAIGVNYFSITALSHMFLRALIIYFFGISLARFNKKILGIRTPFNFILLILLGSIFANGIVDVKLFIPIIATVLFLFLVSGLTTMLAFYFPSVETFLKSHPANLVINGKIQWSSMKNNLITKQELLNELNAQLHTNNLKTIEKAILTSDGSINFITIKKEPTS